MFSAESHSNNLADVELGRLIRDAGIKSSKQNSKCRGKKCKRNKKKSRKSRRRKCKKGDKKCKKCKKGETKCGKKKNGKSKKKSGKNGRNRNGKRSSWLGDEQYFIAVGTTRSVVIYDSSRRIPIFVSSNIHCTYLSLILL